MKFSSASLASICSPCMSPVCLVFACLFLHTCVDFKACGIATFTRRKDAAEGGSEGGNFFFLHFITVNVRQLLTISLPFIC